MKPGRVTPVEIVKPISRGQEVIRVDWFTLLFKVTRISHRGGALRFVASVNGATKLILKREVCPQVDARAFRHLNHFRTFSFPTQAWSLTRRLIQLQPSTNRFPWSSPPRLLFPRDVHIDPVATARGTDSRH